MGSNAERTETRGRVAIAPRVLALVLAMALLAALIVTLQQRGDGDPQRISANGAAAAGAPAAPALAPPLGANRTIATSLAGANGRTRIERSLPCDGSRGDAGYWHLQGETALPGGVLTAAAQPGDARLFADLHSPHHTIRTSPEPLASPGPIPNSAYLPADSSRVSLSNARGTVKLGLVGGACPAGDQVPNLPFGFDGSNANGVGSWSVISSSGSYRQAAGTGTYDLRAGFLPGADNPWSVAVNGTIAVLQPKLDVALADVYWGHDGVDYALRQVAAVYRVTNSGAGDTYNAALTAASSPTPGASLIRILINGHNLLIDGNTPMGGFPRSIGDLAAGEVVDVTVVWQLPLPAGKPPCKAVLLGCSIATSLTFSAPDALDLPTTHSANLTVKAPNLPPPL